MDVLGGTRDSSLRQSEKGLGTNGGQTLPRAQVYTHDPLITEKVDHDAMVDTYNSELVLLQHGTKSIEKHVYPNTGRKEDNIRYENDTTTDIQPAIYPNDLDHRTICHKRRDVVHQEVPAKRPCKENEYFTSTNDGDIPDDQLLAIDLVSNGPPPTPYNLNSRNSSYHETDQRSLKTPYETDERGVQAPYVLTAQEAQSIRKCEDLPIGEEELRQYTAFHDASLITGNLQDSVSI